MINDLKLLKNFTSYEWSLVLLGIFCYLVIGYGYYLVFPVSILLGVACLICPPVSFWIAVVSFICNAPIAESIKIYFHLPL